MAMNIDDFVFGIKGVPFTPGQSGFPESIGVGSRQAFNLQFREGASYWWNAAGDNPMDIHKLAMSSVTYANAQRLDARDVNETIARGNGMTVGELRSAIEQGDNKGSIAFARIPKGSSSLYSGGGENWGEAFQASESIRPRAVMQLPTQVEHHPGGASFISNGERTSLNVSHFKEGQMHDWMKSFAQNIRDTVGEGVTLPAGTQELLDAPTMEEGTAAFRRYLDSAGKTINYPEARLTSIMPDEDGLIQFEYNDPQRGMVTGRTRRSSVDEFFTGSRPQALGSPVQGITSRVQPQTATISAGKAVGGTSDAVARVSAQQATEVVAPAARRAIEETASGVISPKTLKGILQAGETAAKIMRL